MGLDRLRCRYCRYIAGAANALGSEDLDGIHSPAVVTNRVIRSHSEAEFHVRSRKSVRQVHDTGFESTSGDTTPVSASTARAMISQKRICETGAYARVIVATLGKCAARGKNVHPGGP